MIRIAKVFCTVAWIAGGSAHAALVNVNNTTFVDYVDDLKSEVFQSGSNDYVVPQAGDLTAFRALADSLWVAKTQADLQGLVTPADNLGYDVVRLTDAGVTYFGVREQLIGNPAAHSLGWGSYFVRQGDRRDAMVQAPHPLFDTNTPEVAALSYVDSMARGFLMAGAHRNANGQGTADVADPIGSVFQEVHEAWNGQSGEVVAWQLHGFNINNYLPGFPNDTDAVLSNGTGDVSPEVVALDGEIEALGAQWESYAYNSLGVNDPLNIAVNGVVDGADFGPPGGLGGTTNVQQLHSTGLGGTFVHIELEQSFRIDNGGAAIPLAAQAIANAIASTTSLSSSTPEPSSAALLLWGVLWFSHGRTRVSKRVD